MRLLLVPALACCLATGTLAAAQTPAGIDAPSVQDASKPLPAAFTAKVIKRSNVRFGPNIAAKPVTILDIGTEVEVIGRAEFAKGWWEIRFPQKGACWVHENNLRKLDDKRWQVTKQNTRARDDATLGASIVKEMAVGEIVEDRGQQVGQWRSVWIPNAVAYIYESNLQLPQDPAAAIAEREGKEKALDEQWRQAARTYAAYWDILQKNFESALVLDWDGLAAKLQDVAKGHADSKARVDASRIIEVIAQVKAAAEQYRKAHPEAKPEIPQIPAPGTEPAAGTGTKPPAGLQGPAPVAVAPTASVKQAYAAEGMLEQKDYAAVGAQYHLIDGDGNVRAFIKLKDGSAIQLSEYVWCPVGVRGAVEPVESAKHGIGSKSIPLVTVDEIVLQKK